MWILWKSIVAIKTYIRKQLKEDLEYDQMSLVEYIDPLFKTNKPFMGLCQNKEALKEHLIGTEQAIS